MLDRDTQSLHPTFIEYIDGARLFLECESEKDVQAIQEIKLHFGNFIRKMIKSFPCKYFIQKKGKFIRQKSNVLFIPPSFFLF